MKTGSLKAILTCLVLLFAKEGVTDVYSTNVMANLSVNVESLSPAQLRMIFAGRTQFWPDGSRIRVFVLPSGNPLHQEFCRTQLNVYPYQLERIWQRVVYSGQGVAPHVVSSPEILIENIANTPGSIGYMPKHVINPKAKNLTVLGGQP
ncbi:hypothetical protein [Alteromonas gilva]|uniref:PBP domain-containing protein n=1 Tax=Alteromonas gilva TaxID=2987522 RepID=A0ABT5L477_9ALTE|nr:hypothetical protein [Alteromonas gilva]MDC8831840.1 hypothetical protein [Alteromonas gilva]